MDNPPSTPESSARRRARDLGIPLEGIPGSFNAITDVPGLEVGYTTLIRGEGKLIVGQGPVRTGVTAILPRGKRYDPVFAAGYVLNGNGEMTGMAWLEESGFLESPVLLTNTHSVGVARDAAVAWMVQHGLFDPLSPGSDTFWLMPVVAETYDGGLNDINGFHLKPDHVFSALDGATGGPLAEGNVGGGTGMICHRFKGGTGTASREVKTGVGDYRLGVLVQANYGSREDLTVAGVPVGREIPDLLPEFHAADPPGANGSIIVVVATDAPLLPHQLKRLARRVPLGLGRVGGLGANTSGDIFLTFSTANPGAAHRRDLRQLTMLPNDRLDPLLRATIQATEEAILNALIAAETMEGINGYTVYALPHDRLQEILKKYKRFS